MRPLFSPSPVPLAKDSLFGRRRRERLKKASESFELAKQQVARIIHLLSNIGLRCQVPYPSWWHRPWKKGANGPSLPVSLIFIISSQSRLKMYNLVGLVRSEVGEMTNDLISQTQVSQVRKLAETRYFRLVFFRWTSSALRKKRNWNWSKKKGR